MATSDSTGKFTVEGLTALAARLGDLADATLARRDAATDMRHAAQSIDRLATLILTIGEISQKAIDNPGWDNAAIARDMRDAILVAMRDE